MKKRRLLIIWAMFLVVFGAWAKQRTVDQARALAKTFLASPSAAGVATGGQPDQLTLVYTATGAESGKPDVSYYYVFDRGASRGFIIISSDDRAKEILGYADAGNFDIKKLPDNFKYWLSVYERELELLAGIPDSDTKIQFQPNPPPLTRAPSFEASVAPLVKSKWGQGDPYNLQTPIYGGSHLVTGCVATAMAQIMNYHEWPVTGTGSHTYTSATLDITSTADFGATTYDWANMTDMYGSSATTAQKNAVATLMFHCGVAVEMDYNTTSAGGSGAYSSDVPYALRTYFGYDPGMEFLYRDYTVHSEWVELLKTELTSGRPVYYSGQGGAGGHAFVCDGYDTSDKFHFNWGWSGLSDGYYELSALDPISLGVGGGSGGFNYSQGIITGIQKPQPIPGETSFKWQYNAVSSNKTSLASTSDQFNLSVTSLWNLGEAAFTGSIGAALYTEGNSLVNYRQMVTISSGNAVEPGYGWNPLTMSNYTLPGGLSAGVYKLYPAYSVAPNPDVPHLMGAPSGGVPYLIINVATNGSVSISQFVDRPNLTLEEFTVDSLYRNRIAEVKAKITNNGADYICDLRLLLQGSSSQQFSCPVAIGKGETKEFTFVIQPTVTAGNYTLDLSYETTNGDGNNWTSLGSKSVTVQPVPANPSVSLVGNLSFPNANRVSKLAPRLSARVKNTGGFYGNIIEADVHNTGGYYLLSFGSQTVTLEQNEEKDIVLNSDIALEPGNYKVRLWAAGNSPTALNTLIDFTLVEPETDNTLSGLTLSAGSLSPAFAPATQDYTVSVSSATSAITLTGTATSQYAAIVGNGTKPLAPGENKFTLVVTAENGGSKTYTIVVTRDTQSIPLNAGWISITGGPFTYDGAQQTPAFTVNDGTQDLTEGTDYTVVYGENINAGSGAGSVTITGAGVYSGTVSKTFDIGKKALTATVTSVSPKTYDGTKTAAVVLTPSNLAAIDAGQVSLTATAEFDNKNAGVNKPVAITGITLNGAKSANYEAPDPSVYTGLAADITPAPYAYTIAAAQTILQGSSLTNIEAPAFGTGVIVEGNAEQVAGTLNWYADATWTTPADNAAFAAQGNVTLYWKFITSDANYTPSEKTGGPVAFTVVAGDPQDISFAMTSPVTKIFGDEAFTNQATNNTPGGGAITYSSSDPSIATVEPASGLVSILAAGSVTITAKAAMVPGQYRETEASYTLIVSPKPLTGAQVSVAGAYTYDGTLQTPAEANVSVSLGGQTLVHNTDYTFSGGGQSVGEASITVTGQGNYTGTATGSFTIGKRTLTATATAADKVYDATTAAVVTLTPGNVTGSETVSLTATGTFADANAGAGKTVSLSNIQLGGANAGNYNPPAINSIVAPTASITPAGYIYTVGATQSVTIGSTLEVINVAPPQGTGVNNEPVSGTLQWFSDPAFAMPATDAAFATLGDITLYWRFTAANPNYTNSPATGVTLFTVTDGDPQPISFAESEVTKTYGDADFTLTATNADDGGAITYLSTDPTVATVDATTGQVHILKTGVAIIKAQAAAVPGKYAASEASYTLTVNQKSLSGATVTISGVYTYNANQQIPSAQDVNLSLGGLTLTHPADYTFALTQGGIDAGQATLTLTGAGNYTGTVTGVYQIDKALLTIDIASSIVAPKAYDGTADAVITSVGFTGLTGSETLSKETDYTVTDARYNSANVADANLVTATVALIETGPVARNYTLTSGAFSKAATIDKATVAAGADQRVEALENYAHAYDFDLETLLPAITGTFGSVSYAIDAIDNSAGVLGTLNYTGGTNLVLPVQAVAAGQSAIVTIRIASDNYTDILAVIRIVTTSRKQVNISAVMAGGVYNGNAYAYNGTPVITEVLGGEAVTGLTLETLYEDAAGVRTATAPVNAGNYKLILSVPADHVLYFGSASFEFGITQRPVQIVADDKTALAGDPLPAFTYHITGVVAGETAITGAPVLSSPAANMSVAGSYVIEVDLTGVTPTANYTFDSTPARTGVLRVEALEPNIIPVGGVSLNVSGKELAIGETFQLEARVYPANATNGAVTWHTSNPAVATVSDDGQVSGIAQGTAIITVTTDDGGYEASCTVTVGSNTVGTEQISQDVTVFFHQSTLLVNSPSGETVALYSFNGQLLFHDRKPRGEAAFTIGLRIGEKILIVKGSSGWTKKIYIR
ncbi:MAG: C10 family peptidase [Tannerellaceae bacterium]|jgi:uncharacterized protein YjdB|nr:C10 family peptidase [Tannerellaceae bacterium]